MALVDVLAQLLNHNLNRHQPTANRQTQKTRTLALSGGASSLAFRLRLRPLRPPSRDPPPLEDAPLPLGGDDDLRPLRRESERERARNLRGGGDALLDSRPDRDLERDRSLPERGVAERRGERELWERDRDAGLRERDGERAISASEGIGEIGDHGRLRVGPVSLWIKMKTMDKTNWESWLTGRKFSYWQPISV
jgi:hypothetical protein